MIRYSSEGKKKRLYLTIIFEIFRISSFENKSLKISKNVRPVGVFQERKNNLGFRLVSSSPSPHSLPFKKQNQTNRKTLDPKGANGECDDHFAVKSLRGPLHPGASFPGLMSRDMAEDMQGKEHSVL